MKTHGAIPRIVGAIVFVQLAVTIACVDTTPIEVPSAALDGGADANGACLACIESPNAPGPGCADELAACDQYALCTSTGQCAIASHCYDAPSIADFASCSVECGEEIGIAADPDALAAATAVFICTIGFCNDVCGVPTPTADGAP